jgi:hypothetical protein
MARLRGCSLESTYGAAVVAGLAVEAVRISRSAIGRQPDRIRNAIEL